MTNKRRTSDQEPQPTTAVISAKLIAQVCQRLEGGQPVRRTLPGEGRLHMDRPLPFLCVYRQPADAEDAGTQRLVKGEAAYLLGPNPPYDHASLSSLVRDIAKAMTAEFGAFLILEIWAGEDGGKANDAANPSVSPRFTIHAPEDDANTKTVETLEKHLGRVKILSQQAKAGVVYDGDCCPPGLQPLLSATEASDLNCFTIGLRVPPVYRKAHSEREFPLLMRAFRRSLSLALRYAFFEFVHSKTTHLPPHFHSLGRRAVVKAVWEIDDQLARVSNRFSYLQYVTPVNTKRAWRQFQKDNFAKPPKFHYRPLSVDPDLLKRKLYQIPIERIEDPALQKLFREKRNELDLKLTMLRDRDTSRFLPESLQLFGGVDADLITHAKELLAMSLPEGVAKVADADRVDAQMFARRAEAEFQFYRTDFADFTATVEVSEETNGLVVANGKLHVSSDLSLSPARVDALLAHEVGTHLVTYYNGLAQPFQQLYSGLAGYEELQEGLAVLAEYLVGGLTQIRLRQLAARVVAVAHLTDGASFLETFRSLEDYGLSRRGAWGVTMRVYRGGGFTKDAIYLRGLEQVLEYLKKGGNLEPLFAGKMATRHIPLIKELQYRKVLKPVPVVPRYMRDPKAVERLGRLSSGEVSVMDLVRGVDGDAASA